MASEAIMVNLPTGNITIEKLTSLISEALYPISEIDSICWMGVFTRIFTWGGGSYFSEREILPYVRRLNDDELEYARVIQTGISIGVNLEQVFDNINYYEKFKKSLESSGNSHKWKLIGFHKNDRLKLFNETQKQQTCISKKDISKKIDSGELAGLTENRTKANSRNVAFLIRLEAEKYLKSIDIDVGQCAATPAPVKDETTEGRRARWLDWYGKGEHGALQRVYERELLTNPKADRSYMGKQIEKAKKEKASTKQGGAIFGQLVQDGKRIN